MNLLIQIDERSCHPLYKQIVEHICSMVSSGKLAPGTRLPSSRELSKFLSVSRWTVDHAYEELIRQRVIESRPAVGTFVSERQLSFEPPVDSQDSPGAAPPRAVPQLSDFGSRVADHNVNMSIWATPETTSFTSPDASLLPINKWRELTSKVSRNRSPMASHSCDVFGDPNLRQVLSEYLARTRGVRCSAEQMVIFPGTEPALELVVRMFINPGETAAVENPGFTGIRRVLSMHGIEIAAVPVDAEGMQVQRLSTLRDARLVCITPSHQDPTGVALSQQRRLELLRYAHANGSLIVEDDYDSEFHYGRPLPSLQSLDPTGPIIYMSSFFKVLYPLVHLGFLVLPLPMVPLFRRAMRQVEADFHTLEQAVLTEFIAHGHLERHIRQVRSLLVGRRRALVSSLLKHLSGKARLSTVSGGTHVILRMLTEDVSDTEILQHGLAAGLPIMSTKRAYHEGHPQGEFVISFSHLDEAEIEPAVSKFAACLSTGTPAVEPMHLPVGAAFSASSNAPTAW
jgi:GntR family transcriptional regulator/MocR family aminotransferase